MSFDTFMHYLMVSDTNTLGLIDITLAMAIPFFLAFPITWVYRATQTSHSYSVHMIRSIFLFASLTSIVTMLIGSNIARAFGLVGALSIIRFRNALKSPIDAVYIFWALTVGMACGTGFFLAAFVLVALAAAFMMILHYSGYGEPKLQDSILKVTTPTASEGEIIAAAERVLGETAKSYRKLNVLFDSDADTKTYVYQLRNNKKARPEVLEGKIKGIPGVKGIHHINNEAPLFLS